MLEDKFVQEINNSIDSTRKQLASLLGLFALHVMLYIEVECMFMIREKIDSKTCQYFFFPLYLNSRVLL